MTYQKGDIISVNFPFTNMQGAKKRPALIISNSRVNSTGDYLAVLITSKIKRDKLSIPINKEDFRHSILPLKSYIRFHKIALLHKSLIHKKITTVKADFRIRVAKSILSIIK